MSVEITKCDLECRSNCSHLNKPSIPEAVVSVEQNPEVSALFAKTKCNFECRSNCSHLKKPSIPEAVVSVEQNPEVSALFANFLQEKATATGSFGIRDRLKYHAQRGCIQFIDAHGTKAHLKAIWQMGIIGLLHYRQVSKLTPQQRDLLRKELEFYRRCLRLQTAENFEDLQTAHEYVLALADGQVGQENNINSILDNHFLEGKSVSAGILRYKMQIQARQFREQQDVQDDKRHDI